ncbi:MAG: hypothetical protein KF712_13140 [Akkermansiaceae bacterium]|nr:hypothetical protein [Akkermansiaceae bacterium]
MDLASPEIQLLGFCVLLLALGGAICASVVFLREKGAGPRIMLVGSILSLTGMIPQALTQFIDYRANKGYEPLELPQVVYFTFWNWLPTASALVFAGGLLMTAFQRRGLSKRIAELESILSVNGQRSSDNGHQDGEVRNRLTADR